MLLKKDHTKPEKPEKVTKRVEKDVLATFYREERPMSLSKKWLKKSFE